MKSTQPHGSPTQNIALHSENGVTGVMPNECALAPSMTGSSTSQQGHSEAHALAQWTMDEAIGIEAGSAPNAPVAIETFENPGAPVFPAGAFAAEGQLGQGRTVADLVFRDLDSHSPTASSYEQLTIADASISEQDSGRAGAKSASAEPHVWDFDHAQPEFITSEIDRKIDEALAMTSQFAHPHANSGQTIAPSPELDELDLPAFLRHGASELPAR